MKKLFIGIDFSKEKFDATIILACGMEEIGQRAYGTFENAPKGFRQFFKWVSTNSWDTTQEEWLFCGEDTGSCSSALSKWLYGKGADMWLANAYDIKHSGGIQRLKSDKADSAYIAEYAWRHQDKARMFEPLSSSLVQLREVFLYRHKLVLQKAAIEMRKNDKERGEGSKAMTFIKRKSKHLLLELEKTIKECDKMIDELIESDAELKQNYEIITSVKGVARQNGACMLIYTNNFKKFELNARKIACYYGVAPFGEQSGTSVNTPPHTSHFANKLIKSLLGQSAHIATIYNPEIAEYYQGLITKGKKPQVALNNVKNKLIRIIVALVKKKQKYDGKIYRAQNVNKNNKNARNSVKGMLKA